LMAQGKDFCLECHSGTQDCEKGNQDGIIANKLIDVSRQEQSAQREPSFSQAQEVESRALASAKLRSPSSLNSTTGSRWRSSQTSAATKATIAMAKNATTSRQAKPRAINKIPR